MRVILLKLHQAAAKKQGKLSRPGDVRLWHIGAALAVGFAAALLGLAGLAWLAWALLRYPEIPHPRALSLHETAGVLQLVFASVAGAGALVALIVAYRRQKVTEAQSVHDRTRVFNERFTAIAAQFGDDKPAVRLAGVHAMAGLADDWQANRQTCIDVLCAYLRMPYEPDPGESAPPQDRLAFRASREVRDTVVRVITAHFRPEAGVSWQGLNLDFAGVVFDEVDFSGAVFCGGVVSFTGARFSGGVVSFTGAKFSGGVVTFDRAEFSGSLVSFECAAFSRGAVSFIGAAFSSGLVKFVGAEFTGAEVSFGRAKFSGGLVSFGGAEFTGGEVGFDSANFSGGMASFRAAKFSGTEVSFGAAEFTGAEVSFGRAKFSGGLIRFGGAEFVSRGVSFEGAAFSAGVVDLRGVELWLNPPEFDLSGSPPSGVMMPTELDGSPP